MVEYIAPCPICAQNNISNNPPAGLLLPLPVPHRPWSDISLDFVSSCHLLKVTRLYNSGGQTYKEC